MKIEGSVALVTGANRGIGAGHRLAGETSLPLAALAADGFLMFPRDLAPRLHDFMVDPCRRAGFEPLIRSESFHTGWELQILGEAPVVAVVLPLRPKCPHRPSRFRAKGAVTLALVQTPAAPAFRHSRSR